MALTGLTKVTNIGINTTTIPTLGGSRNTGVVTATTFVGDGSGLTGVTGSGAGVIVRDGGSLVGTAGTINFGTNLNVSAISAGIVTVTNAASATALTNLSDVTVTSASNGQILKHNGSVFVNTAETTYSQSSVASGSNVNLRLTDSGGTNDDILITAGSNITFSSVTANGFTIAASGGGGGGGLSNVVEDTTPQLGGSLDLNNKFITGSGGINVSGVTTSTAFVGNITGNLTGNITGAVTVGGNISGPLLNITAGSGNDGIILLNSGGGQNNDFTRIRQVVADDSFLIENKSSGSYESFLKGTSDRAIELHHQGSKKLETDQAGVKITGVCTATTFSGSGVALSGVVTSIVAGSNITLTGGPTGIVTIAASGGGGGGISLSGGVDNRVVTASSASAVQGEANLTFNGTTLALTGSQTVSGSVVVGSAVTVNSSGINIVGAAITAYDITADNNLTTKGGSLAGSSKLMISGGSGFDMNYYAGGTAYSNHIFRLMQSGSTIERFRISQYGVNVAGIATATSFVGDLTGDVTGNADTATTATNVTVTANNSTNETVYPIFVDGATGAQGAESDTGLSYNPNSGALTAGSFVKSGGSSSQFLKADGSVDGSTYLTSGSYLENVVEDTTPQLGGNLDLNSKNITGTGNAQIVGVITATSAVPTWTLGASGTDHYTFTGNGFTSATNDPDIYLERGKRYAFLNNAGTNHPFWIKTTPGTGTGNPYNTGVTNNGAQSGYVTFNVPWDAPAHLYYQCQAHGNMVGNIYIRGGSGGETNVGVITATAFVPTTGQLSHRNIIINGACEVAQRGTSSSSVGYQTVDRFKLGAGGADEVPQQYQGNIASHETPYSYGFRKTFYIVNGNQTGGAGSGDYAEIQYKVEAQDIANSGWNYTSSSSYITLSFWLKSNVGQNYYGFVYSADGTAQRYIFETGTITANSWNKIVVTIPGGSNVAFDTDNGEGLIIKWIPFYGTDKTNNSATVGSWANYNGAARTPDNTDTWWTTNNSTFFITGIQLEVGPVATPFEHRSYGDELLRCYRYYYRLKGENNKTYMSGMSDNDDLGIYGLFHFPVPMRIAPTAIEQSGSASDYKVRRDTTKTCTAVPAFIDAMDFMCRVNFPRNGHGWGTGQMLWLQGGSSSSYLGFSAEL